MRRLSTIRAAVAGAIVSLSCAAVYAISDVPLPARFTAWAVSMEGGGTASIDLTVSRWSTPEEVDRLASTFKEQGTDGLAQILEQLPRTGSFRVNGGLRYDVHFAQRSSDPKGGQRVFVIAARRLGFAESANMATSADYPLTVMELHITDNGEGTGTMWPVARISYWNAKAQFVVVDNYTMQPIQLAAVRLHKNHRG